MRPRNFVLPKILHETATLLRKWLSNVCFYAAANVAKVTALNGVEKLCRSRVVCRSPRGRRHWSSCRETAVMPPNCAGWLPRRVEFASIAGPRRGFGICGEKVVKPHFWGATTSFFNFLGRFVDSIRADTLPPLYGCLSARLFGYEALATLSLRLNGYLTTASLQIPKQKATTSTLPLALR
jgi:hypothetical protein